MGYASDGVIPFRTSGGRLCKYGASCFYSSSVLVDSFYALKPARTQSLNRKRNKMERHNQICQSCGMPLDKDPNKGGTNADNSISDKYCSFCLKDGKFSDEGISLQEKIEKNVQIAVARMGIPEHKAREIAENILPKLERWKK